MSKALAVAQGNPPPLATPIAQAFERFAPIEALVSRRTSFRTEQFLQRASTFPPLDRRFIEPARQRLRLIPDRATLHDQITAIWDACHIPATSAEVHIFVALCLDGIPATASKPTDSLIQATAIVLCGSPFDDDQSRQPLSCPVLAAATRSLWATHRFAPAPSEFLAAAISARHRYLAALAATDRLIALRMDAEDVIEILVGPSVEAEDSDDIPS